MAPRTFTPKNHAEASRPLIGSPAPPREILDLRVIFTGLSAAKAALDTACAYARDLHARITIMAAQVVPYPLPLEEPPVPVSLIEKTLGALAADQPVETGVEIYLCRDSWETIRHVLRRESTVIVTGRKRWWWPTREQRFASLLRRDGHRVVFVNLEAA